MDQKLTMKDIEGTFETAKILNCNFIVVAISVPEFSKPQLLINEKSDFDKKLEYYKNAYNHDLTLKSCPEIKIISIDACSGIQLTPIGNVFFDEINRYNKELQYQEQ